MAQQVLATIYGMDNNMWTEPQLMSFPTQGVGFFVPPAGTVSYYGINLYGGILAVWEKGQPQYLTEKSVVQLATESNS